MGKNCKFFISAVIWNQSHFFRYSFYLLWFNVVSNVQCKLVFVSIGNYFYASGGSHCSGSNGNEYCPFVTYEPWKKGFPKNVGSKKWCTTAVYDDTSDKVVWKPTNCDNERFAICEEGLATDIILSLGLSHNLFDIMIILNILSVLLY